MPRLKVVALTVDTNVEIASLFGVADIRPLDASRNKAMLNVVLPVNGRAKGEEVVLEPGAYRVRVRLPSGETLVEDVEVGVAWPRSTLVIETNEIAFRRPEKSFASGTGYAPIVETLSGRGLPVQVRGEKKRWNWGRHVFSSPTSEWLRERDGFRSLFVGVGDSSAPYVLHRLKAQATDLTLRALQDEGARPGEVARSSFGEALAVQPTKVKTPRKGPPSSEWKVAERGRMDESRRARYYGVLVANTSDGVEVQKVASIPDRWIGLDGSEDDLFRAEIVAHPDFEGEARIQLTVSDPKARSLMWFLQTGDLDAALAVSRPAMGFVRQGVLNAHAAVAAAYALVYAPAGYGVPGWEEWVLELARDRIDIPDGKILEATLLLQREVSQLSFDGARFPPPTQERTLTLAWNCVQEALRRGPPVFRLGLRLLAENIRIIKDAECEVEESNVVTAAANVTGWLRARVDPYQPLCVFDVS